MNDASKQGGICRGDGGHSLVSEFRGMALNGLFCADVLQPLDLVPSLTLPTNTVHPASKTIGEC